MLNCANLSLLLSLPTWSKQEVIRVEVHFAAPIKVNYEAPGKPIISLF